MGIKDLLFRRSNSAKARLRNSSGDRRKSSPSAEDSGAVMLPVAEQVKYRQPGSINDDRFAVNEA
jgi:hypothetical protein